MAWVADLDADGQVEADVLEEAAGPVEAATCCPCSSLGPCFLQAQEAFRMDFSTYFPWVEGPYQANLTVPLALDLVPLEMVDLQAQDPSFLGSVVEVASYYTTYLLPMALLFFDWEVVGRDIAVIVQAFLLEGEEVTFRTQVPKDQVLGLKDSSNRSFIDIVVDSLLPDDSISVSSIRKFVLLRHMIVRTYVPIFFSNLEGSL